MKIEQNYDLTRFNTFGIHVTAKFFIEIGNENELKELFENSIFKNNEKLFLGGGSNVLFTKDFEGIVILNKIKGIEIVKENSDSIFIKANGGEIWNDLVTFAVNHDYWGIENLALVPGTVGAAPIQNIGAYGGELKEVLESVEAYDIKNGEKKIFSKEDCELGYRDSVFKNKFKGQYFITAIIIILSKKNNKKITYKILQEYLDKNNKKIKNSKDISEAVSSIRRSKLPDPKILGNAGSFFKNVFLPAHRSLGAGGEKVTLGDLLEKYPNIPYFTEDDLIKIPAGWFIEQCGWKGKRVGNVGVHDKQALVLVNYGGATGEELKNLAFDIINSVNEKFGLKLIPEVNLI